MNPFSDRSSESHGFDTTFWFERRNPGHLQGQGGGSEVFIAPPKQSFTFISRASTWPVPPAL